MPIEPRSEIAADDVVRAGGSHHGTARDDLVPTGAAPSPHRFGVQPKLLAALLIAQGTVWMTFFPIVLIAMPAKVKVLSPDHYTSFFSLTLVLATLAGLVAGPVIGRLSDRSTSRFGRRRPWLLGSMGIGLVGVSCLAFAPSVAVFVVGAVLAQIGFGGVTAIQYSLLPEHVAVERRGSFGMLLGITIALSTIIGLVLSGGFAGTGNFAAAFLSVAAFGTLGVLLLARTLPDSHGLPGLPPLNLLELAKAFYFNPRQAPDFAWGWLSRFMFYLSAASAVTYSLYYLGDQLGLSDADAAHYSTVGTAAQVLTVIIGAVIGGPLSDRIGRRKPFVAAAAGIALLGLVSLALATSIPGYLAGILLIGLATGVYNAVDIALMTAVLPNDIKDAGKDLGIMNIANTLPNTLSGAFAPALLAIGLFSVVDEPAGKNYTMLFLGSAVFALVSVFSVLKIRGVR